MQSAQCRLTEANIHLRPPFTRPCVLDQADYDDLDVSASNLLDFAGRQTQRAKCVTCRQI